jgi:NADH-ubiquinone oxidoreductase chain 5
VSALVHSSTLVTAGVFLLIRFYPSFHHLNTLKSSLLLVSSITILIAGIAAITECDLKKIIALSTLSQLGLIIATLALGISTLATFHLLTHALFKALLFICAGTIIHFFHHTQDLRHTGNAPSQLPLTTSAITIANLALCGTPFLAGFYSKDLILEILLFNPANSLITLIFLAATILTAAYSTRFSLILLFTPPTHMPLHAIHDEDLHLTIPIFSLASAATLAGSIIN